MAQSNVNMSKLKSRTEILVPLAVIAFTFAPRNQVRIFG